MTGIIIEGPNASGKSTLSETLAKELGKVVTHAGTSPGDDYLTVACEKQLMELADGHILDRCTPISEPVYNKELNHAMSLTLHLWGNMMTFKSVIVYCTADGEPVHKDYYPKGHFDVVSDTEDIRQRYDLHMKLFPHITYNWKTDDLASKIEEIKECMKSITCTN